MKKETIEMVAEWHEAFGVVNKLFPDVSDEKINELRVSLLREELDELKEALDDEDKVEALDALCDLQYVLDGAFLSLGFARLKSKAFEEVQRSNMSKLGKDGKPVYREDGKVLKGPSFTRPDLASIVHKAECDEALEQM